MNSKDSKFEEDLKKDIDDIQNVTIKKLDKDIEKIGRIGQHDLELYVDFIYDEGESELLKTKEKRKFNESFIGKLLKFIFR